MRKINTANIKMVHLDNNYLHKSKMVESYPTVYFINTDKTVKNIWAYGAEMATSHPPLIGIRL